MNSLRELRKNKNLTISEVAEKLNMPFETYRSYEIGRRQADYDTLIRIAEYYGVSVDYVIGRDEIAPEERALGMSHTRKEEITVLEEEMLYAFRAVGIKQGERGQRALIDVANGMAGIK